MAQPVIPKVVAPVATDQPLDIQQTDGQPAPPEGFVEQSAPAAPPEGFYELHHDPLVTAKQNIAQYPKAEESGMLDKADTAITGALAPNPHNYNSVIKTNAIEAPKTLGRELYSGGKSILGYISGLAAPETEEEKEEFRQHGSGPIPGEITLERLLGAGPIVRAGKAYADPKTRPTVEGALSVAPEAMGTGAGAVMGSKLAEVGLPKITKAAAPVIKAGAKSIATPNTDLPRNFITGDQTSIYKQPQFEPYGKASMEATKTAVDQGRASKVPTKMTPEQTALDAAIAEGKASRIPTKVVEQKPAPSPVDTAVAEGRANRIPTKLGTAKPEPSALDVAIAEGKAAPIPVKLKPEASPSEAAIAEGRASKVPTKLAPMQAEPSPLDAAIAEGKANPLPTKIRPEAEQAIAEGKASKLPTTIKPVKKASPLGSAVEAPKEPTALGSIEPDKPITSAEVKSSPGTSMATKPKTVQEVVDEKAAAAAPKPPEEPPTAPVAAAKPEPVAPKEGGEAVEKPKTVHELLDTTLGEPSRAGENLEKSVRENGRQELPRGDRRATPRSPEELKTQELFGQARKELGEDATSDDVVKRVAELKAQAKPPSKFTDEERGALKTLGFSDEELAQLEPRLGAEPHEEALAEEHVARFTNENLKKFAKDLGIDPDKYDFSKREPVREGGQKHPVQRTQLVKDIMKRLPAEEKTALVRAGEGDPQFWEDRDQAQKAKAARSESYSPRLQRILEAEKAPKAEGAAVGKEGEGENSRPLK
jgi:hypothetical protein